MRRSLPALATATTIPSAIYSAAHFLTPCSSSPGTMVRGTPTGKLNDDLPSEEEDDGEGMGDFAADIGGGKDDY